MDIQNNQNDKPKGLGYFESFKIKKRAEFALTNSAPLQMMHYITSNKKNLLEQMSSFKFLFFGWLFASQKMREMLCISRPEFALQTRAFQGSVRTSCYLHSFATLRNWLRQPLQSLPRFVNQILEIEPTRYLNIC